MPLRVVWTRPSCEEGRLHKQLRSEGRRSSVGLPVTSEKFYQIWSSVSSRSQSDLGSQVDLSRISGQSRVDLGQPIPHKVVSRQSLGSARKRSLGPSNSTSTKHRESKETRLRGQPLAGAFDLLHNMKNLRKKATPETSGKQGIFAAQSCAGEAPTAEGRTRTA